jgi:hypothetical protein
MCCSEREGWKAFVAAKGKQAKGMIRSDKKQTTGAIKGPEFKSCFQV